ncbi:hypothetical protein PJK45_05820 [Mycobacterium kansasii]|uniref:Uncharacterized protein n=3 Tax=Mycobacterium kansasii TaxID=1768 RepID=A0A1V3WTQ4_MYCKA|nr:hypothetical protein [Mycobacterium kansasii]ETZ98847.1 hypothetical protein I547_5943 [Mycobacterium kansasii 824]EUA17688.1 hypothetical protein I545_3328 [Mycobacterium kansasii 662]KEP39373.1 hypothetical protein MKSMC1_54220 [Mycobacterium kansasii]OOK70295.1 hypothetical protein BZL30_6155 [Mycobacterium kansasii]OOK74985.1 hypothetical protein BZL29_4207 [Mycobacterium kansasii]
MQYTAFINMRLRAQSVGHGFAEVGWLWTLNGESACPAVLKLAPDG